jgi:spore coat polysaccharide biosynthesis protein SpsF (cytidylyltransferase family)
MVGIFIIARLGSTRLQKKHLIKVKKKTFIEWLTGRFLAEFAEEVSDGSVKIAIATSVRPENEEFFSLFKNTPVSVFQGSDENIPLRLLECAEYFGTDSIISIDGDDILCSASSARLVVERLNSGINMAQVMGLPLGMNVWGFRRSFLKNAINENNSRKLETGWGKIFPPDAAESIHLEGFESSAKLRMTLDYDLDYVFFKTVIENLDRKVITITDKDLVDTILLNNWGSLNDELNEAYWENFNSEKNAEQ